MSSPLQRYASILAGNARSGTGVEYGGAEKAMGELATGSAIATTAMYPVVNNNHQYIDEYTDMANFTNKVGKGAQAYGNYKSALGLVSPSTGGDTMANMLSPGNLVGSGATLAMMSNPVTASLAGINSLTSDEENPYGTIPGVKQANKFVAGVADKMNQTPVAQGIRKGVTSLYDQTMGRVLNTRPGRAFTSVAELPFQVAEAGYQGVREGYQALDRGIFGGLLPWGAQEGKPETQRWDNPLPRLKSSLDSAGENITGMFKEPVRDDGPTKFNDLSEVDYLGNKYGSTGGEQVGDDYSKLEQAKNVYKVKDGGDKEGLNALLDDLLTIGESKGMTDPQKAEVKHPPRAEVKPKPSPQAPKFSSSNYTSKYGGEGRPMIDTGSGMKPLITSPEFMDYLDAKATELGPMGFVKWHQELTGGKDMYYKSPEVFNYVFKIDARNPTKHIRNHPEQYENFKHQGSRFELFAGPFTGEHDLKPNNPPEINTDITRSRYEGIDMNPVAGMQRVTGEHGVRFGEPTNPNGLGQYRLFL